MHSVLGLDAFFSCIMNSRANEKRAISAYSIEQDGGVHINYRPLFLLALGMIAGIAYFYFMPPWAAVVCVCSFVFAVTMAFLLKYRTVAVFAVGVLTGIACMALNAPQNMILQENVSVTGRVFDTETDSVILSELELGGKRVKGHLIIRKYTDTVGVDNIMKFNAPVTQTSNVNEGSYKRYLLSERIFYSVNGDEISQMKVSDGSLSIHGIFMRMRSAITKHIERIYGENSQIICGLILGKTGEIDPSAKENLRISGLSHIFALSGLHISVLAWVVEFVLKGLKWYKRKIVVCLFLLIYCGIAGFPASLVRAAVMYASSALVMLFVSHTDGLSSCSLAAAVILLVNPYQIFSGGFLLSFAAVLGILMYERPFRSVLCEKVCDGLAASVSVSVSASIGITPALCGMFGAFPLYSLSVNLPAVPISSLALITAVISIIAGAIYLPLAVPFAYVTEVLLDAVLAIAFFASKLPFASVHTGNISVICSVLCMAALYASSVYVVAKEKYKAIISVGLILLAAVFFIIG